MKMYDTLIIELQKNGKAVSSVSIKESDMKFLMESHDLVRGEILSDMVQTMEDGIHQREFGLDSHLNHKEEDVIN
jgi:hypothetical protein